MKTPSSIPLEKLSQLQKLVLVMLLEERYSTLGRPAFRSLVKRHYWGERDALLKKELVAKSLSRALGSLEARGYIVRTRSGWELTDSDTDFVRNGSLFAFCAWRQKKDLYVQLGLRGPSAQSLGIAPPQRKGVEVELSL